MTKVAKTIQLRGTDLNSSLNSVIFISIFGSDNKSQNMHFLQKLSKSAT